MSTDIKRVFENSVNSESLARSTGKTYALIYQMFGYCIKDKKDAIITYPTEKDVVHISDQIEEIAEKLGVKILRTSRYKYDAIKDSNNFCLTMTTYERYLRSGICKTVEVFND